MTNADNLESVTVHARQGGIQLVQPSGRASPAKYFE